MKPAAPALEATDLDIGYAGRAVGQAISLQLGCHEVLCLLGPNGSGKSTLFKTLLGLLPPQGGEIRLHGKALRQWSRGAFAREVGYVPQAHGGLFPFSVEDIVLMGRTARLGRFASPGGHDRRVMAECLDSLGIAHLRQRLYTAISGGERQLVLIARALAQEPSLLVLDEPTASLDFGNQIRVLEHIGRLREHGIGVLLCTHQPEHALRVADRIALFKDGRLSHCGAPESTATTARLAWLYDLEPAQVASNLGHRSLT